jgi:hypothetical protein
MTRDARLSLLEDMGGADPSLSGERRAKVIMLVVTCVFAAIVVLLMIDESHVSVEQRLELLQSSSFYP